MATIPLREAAFVAIKAALVAAFPAATVFRNRRSNIAPDERLPILIQRDGGHQASAADNQAELVYTTTCTIEVHGRAASDDAIGATMNGLHAEVVAALTGIEIAIGGAGQSIWMIEQSAEPEIAAAAGSSGPNFMVSVDFLFDLRGPAAGGPFTTT